jgi:hypothetical protein
MGIKNIFGFFKDSTDSKLILSGLILFFFFSAFNFLFASHPFLFQRPSKKDEITQIASDTREIIKKLSPYENKESLQKVVLVENFENTVENTKQTASFSRKIKVTGKIKQGYLFVRASADSQPLFDGEDVYVKMSAILPPNYSYKEYGGHLVVAKSLDTPGSKSWTEYLYSLDDIKYKDNYLQTDVEITSGNWLRLLNEGNNQFTVGFTSTTKKGIVHELSIYYECQEKPNCLIESVK